MADRRGLAEMIGDGMREIGVLVAAFGMLDKFVLSDGPSTGWTAAVLGTALFFFAVGATIAAETVMAGQYTYLVGLLIFGVILGATGLIAAERERSARRSRQLPLDLPSEERPRQSASIAAR